jgi:hypothetical protein
MRNAELKEFQKLARSKSKWEFTARLLSEMLIDLGVDTAAIMLADKDGVVRMLLEHNRKREATPQ